MRDLGPEAAMQTLEEVSRRRPATRAWHGIMAGQGREGLGWGGCGKRLWDWLRSGLPFVC